MTDPVIVGYDGFERSLRALIWAAHDAALHGCPLYIVHVLPAWEMDFPFHPPGRWQSASRRGAAILAEAEAMVRESHPDLDVGCQQLSGSPSEVLCSVSKQARNVVLGARGEGGLGNLLFGSVGLQVAGHADGPVVVVGQLTTGHHRVVVGTDGSPHSVSAMEFAFDEASLRGTRLQVLRVWQMPVPAEAPERELVPEDVEAEQRREVEEQLAGLRKKYPDVEIETELVRGKAAPALVRASDRADLAVVGSRGRGGFHGLALGSVGHALLHYGTCPIAVVRPRPEPARE
ncbi:MULTISPECIES: universal stress protein [Kitasatospora]|uniref:Universal stress protein n=1 Tax=Kitasatospora cystarginea TaxID=58350 RepID=A0ABP5QWD7_9ACTN